MPKIIFITEEGEVLVEAKIGETLLEAARRNNIPLFGGCDGAGVCGGCHVIVEEDFYKKLPPPSEDEQDTLDMVYGVTSTSRLGCRIFVTKEVEGIRIYLSFG